MSPDVLKRRRSRVVSKDYIEIDDAQRENTRTRGGPCLSNDLRTWMIMGYKYISLNLN